VKLLLLDNYDSFTYNLLQALGALGAEVAVVRNDAESSRQLVARRPAGLVISPGPGLPATAGETLAAVRDFSALGIPILGVCLGHQAIAQAQGGHLVRARQVMHGKTSEIHHAGRGLFRGLPEPFRAARYHSWVVERESLPAELAVSAYTQAGEVMALTHCSRPLFGLQFHPESVATPLGTQLLANFVAVCAELSIS